MNTFNTVICESISDLMATLQRFDEAGIDLLCLNPHRLATIIRL